MAMPPKPSGPEELDESGAVDKAPESSPGTEKKPAAKKIVDAKKGLTRRTLFKWGAVAAAGTALSLAGHDGPEQQQEPFIDVVGGTPPEGAAEFRQHLQALNGILNGEDESARFMIPELQTELHTFTNLAQRIERLEAIMRSRITGRQNANDAVRAMESSNNLILRLILQRLEMQRRLEIASVTRPGDADNLRRLQLQNTQLFAMLKTEINTLASLVDHVETLTSLSSAIDMVPQREEEGKEAQNEYLRTVYGGLNNQVQERMGEPLRVLWGQMPSLGKLVQMRGAITSSILTLRDRDLVNRRASIVPQLIADFERIGDLALPDPDRVEADDGRHDTMDTGRTLVTAVVTALRNFQRAATPANTEAANAALDRLRVAVIRQTDKITNGRPAYLDVQKITLTGVATGSEVDDYRANVYLDRPAGNADAREGRLADVTTIAARVERRRALHQEIRNQIARRNEDGFEDRMKALEFAYRQEMEMEYEDMLRRTSRLALRTQNAELGDTGYHYASRETEARPVHDPAQPDTPETRRQIATGQRGYSSMVELRLLDHPEERAPLEACVRAWMLDGYNPRAETFGALVAQLRRMMIPVPENAADNQRFTYTIVRLLQHAGIANLHVTALPSQQMQALAQQRRQYAQAMLNHANAWMRITDPRAPNAQESLEEMLDMTLIGYSTQTLAEQAQKQGRQLPGWFNWTYNTPIVNWFHHLAPSQILHTISGGRIGTDLRELCKNGGRYMLFYRVLPPEYTAAALLTDDMEKQLQQQNVTREQFEQMNDDQRTAVLARVEERKSETVRDIKRRHAPAIVRAGTGVVQATRLLEAANTTANIRKPEELVVPSDMNINGTLERFITLPEAWQQRVGPADATLAPVLIRERLGNNPFQRLQQACERAHVGLMRYQNVMRRPAGNWWGEGDTVNATRVRAAFDAVTVPPLSDEELLWLYTKLLPGVPMMQGNDEQALAIMRERSDAITKAEAALARSTGKNREAALVEVYRARGALLAIYNQLGAHMQLKNDMLAFTQKHYMTDLAQALGLHLNVAAVQYRLVDHGTAPLTSMLLRAGEHVVTHKVAIPLARYGWRKWREGVKFRKLQRQIKDLEKQVASLSAGPSTVRPDIRSILDRLSAEMNKSGSDANADALEALRVEAVALAAELERQITAINALVEKHKDDDPIPGEVKLAQADLPGLLMNQGILNGILPLLPTPEDEGVETAEDTGAGKPVVVADDKEGDGTGEKKPEDPSAPPPTTT